MKSAEELANDLDLAYGQLNTPTGTEDLLLLLGQGIAAMLRELHDLNMKADQLLRRTD